MNEAQFTTIVIEMAKALGWLVYHQRPARTAKGWRTALQGHAGFPDLVLAKDGRVIFAELKSAKGRLSDAQKGWLEALDIGKRIQHPLSTGTAQERLDQLLAG